MMSSVMDNAGFWSHGLERQMGRTTMRFLHVWQRIVAPAMIQIRVTHACTFPKLVCRSLAAQAQACGKARAREPTSCPKRCNPTQVTLNSIVLSHLQLCMNRYIFLTGFFVCVYCCVLFPVGIQPAIDGTRHCIVLYSGSCLLFFLPRVVAAFFFVLGFSSTGLSPTMLPWSSNSQCLSGAKVRR